MSGKRGGHHSSPALSQLTALHHYRVYVDIGVGGGRVGDLELDRTSPLHWPTWPRCRSPVAICLVLLVRSRGMGWAELGLEGTLALRAHALAAVAIVAKRHRSGAALPWTRPMFLNNHYATLSGALIASMIIIPLQTVIPEELAFRGVLHGAMDRAWGFWGVAAAARCSSGCGMSPRRSV